MTDRPAIKPLEWGETSYGTPEVNTVVGVYRLNRAGDGGWRVSVKSEVLFDSDGRTNFATIEAAKAAAQSDFESRIRSCLLDKPEAVEGEPVADGLVKSEDIDKMVAALGAFRGYEWWMRTENPNPDSHCLAPLVLQNMKLGYENGTLEPTMSQFKNLLTTAMFYQQKCQTAAVAPADTDAAQSEIDRLRRELEEARRALEVASDEILSMYRTWVADDYEAMPPKNSLPGKAYYGARAALRAGEDSR